MPDCNATITDTTIDPTRVKGEGVGPVAQGLLDAALTPTGENSLIARHAAAHSAFAFAGEKDHDAKYEAVSEARDALIRAPCTSPMSIAYKLAQAFEAMDPDMTFLNSTTCHEAIEHPTLSVDAKLIASAFRDLIGMTVVSERRAETLHRQRSSWEQTLADVAEAKASADAVPDPVDDESEKVWDAALEEVANREMRLNRSFAPDFPAVLTKQHQLMAADTYTYETLDEALARFILTNDWTVQLHAYTYMDTVALLKQEGYADPLCARFFPSAFRARLERLGCKTTFEGFSTPSGMRAEALNLINTLTKDQLEELLGAAWLDEYRDNGGSFHANFENEELWRGQSVCPSTERSLVLGRALDEAKANPSPTCDLYAGIRRVVEARMAELKTQVISPSKQWDEIEAEHHASTTAHPMAAE